MKVINWASDREVFNYRGNPVFGRVEIQGEEKQTFQSINFDQQVFIISQWHSSFLFHPEDEENLQVYVQPLNTEQIWLVGIPVLAKNLYRILDG
jgi:hypothetical protein